MFDYVNEYLRRAKAPTEPGGQPQLVVPPVRCAKGLTFSLQASASRHYCSPESDTGPWDTVELGYPSRVLRTIIKHRSGSIYAFVPVDAINRIITKAGGIVHPITVLPPPKKPLKRIPGKKERAA